VKIVVVGCGKVGSDILSSLVREGHEVVGVDTDRAAVDSVTNSNDVLGICANGTEYSTLLDVGMDDTELFIASTESDELNMLSCYIAKKMGAKHTVARIRDKGYTAEGMSFIKKELELDVMINPDYLSAQSIFNILKYPATIKSETFTRRSFEMAELIIKPGTVPDGVTLAELRSRYKAPFLVCAVSRGGKVCIPKGSFKLQAGDTIGIIAETDELHGILKNMEILGKKSRNAMILGASRISMYLSQMLMHSGNSVKIIDRDMKKCRQICEYLPDSATVVCGDGADYDLLEEEGLSRMDAFVALTGMDEENILVSFYAQSRKVPNVIAKVNRWVFTGISRELGLDCIVSPKKITSDILVRYARALEDSIGSQIETMYSLFDGSVEALEFEVSSGFEWCGIKLKDMKIKPDILIAGIIRDGKRMIPCGDDTIMPRDKVIVTAAGIRLRDLSEIML